MPLGRTYFLSFRSTIDLVIIRRFSCAILLFTLRINFSIFAISERRSRPPKNLKSAVSSTLLILFQAPQIQEHQLPPKVRRTEEAKETWPKSLSPRAHHGKGTLKLKPKLKPKLSHKYPHPNQRWNKVLEVVVECLVNHLATPTVPTEATSHKRVVEEIEIGIGEKLKLKCNRSKVVVAAASPSMP